MICGTQGRNLSSTATRIVDPRSVLNITLDAAHNNFTGTRYSDQINGGDGNDTLNGAGGNDRLDGGAGNDSPAVGIGRDLMFGGGNDGATDVFVFSAVTESVNGAGRDVIMDFVAGSDDIDLSGMDANTALAGNQAFAWGATTAAANAVWYTVSGANILLRGDVTGDGVFDFEVQISGLTTLAATDVIL